MAVCLWRCLSLLWDLFLLLTVCYVRHSFQFEERIPPLAGNATVMQPQQPAVLELLCGAASTSDLWRACPPPPLNL